MNRDPVVVIGEFLQHDEPRARMNAAVALGTIGTVDGIRCLIGVALDDGDVRVRDVAERELTEVPADRAERRDAQLRDMLHDRSRRVRVYALMGRLRANGAQLSFPGITWTRWLRLSVDLFSAVHADRTPLFAFRPLPGAVIGAAISFVTLAVFFAALGRSALGGGIHSDLMGTLIGAGLLAMVVGLVACLRTTALGLHFSTLGGYLAETGWSSLTAAVGVGVPIFVGFLLSELGASWPLVAATNAAALVVVGVAAIRSGTILARGLLASRSGSAVMVAATGAATGLVTITLMCTWLPIRPEMWVFSLPACGAVAAAFAAIDARAPLIRRGGNALRATLSVALVGAVALAALLALIPGAGRIVPSHASVPVSTKLNPDQSSVALTVATRPFRVEFELSEKRHIVVTWLGNQTVALLDATDKNIVSTSASIDRDLSAGRYYLVTEGVTRKLQIDADQALGTLLSAYQALRMGREETVRLMTEPQKLPIPWQLTVVFRPVNAPRAVPLPSIPAPPPPSSPGTGPAGGTK